MAAAAVLPAPHDVPTTLNYYSPIGEEAPFIYVKDPPAGVEKNNIGTDPHPATIHDVRGKEDSVSLDKTGFQFVKHVSEEKDFLDEERIKTVYYKEVEELLKKEAGAKRGFHFRPHDQEELRRRSDWNARYSRPRRKLQLTKSAPPKLTSP